MKSNMENAVIWQMWDLSIMMTSVCTWSKLVFEVVFMYQQVIGKWKDPLKPLHAPLVLKKVWKPPLGHSDGIRVTTAVLPFHLPFLR